MNDRIIVRNFQQRTTMPVLVALLEQGDGISPNIAFETAPFINARIYGESTGRALWYNEMIELKNKIDQIVEDFNVCIRGSNLSGEQLQLAKIVYIYNYILANVRYANVSPANDGTARVQVRREDIPDSSAYSALILKEAVCCGISDAIYLLCNVMGIECEKWLWPDGGHAYNKVKIGNEWYNVDATFQIGFYPFAKAENWDTNYLLTATEQPRTSIGQNTNNINYPRFQIQAMKAFLESRGINFSYHPTPKITIKSPLEGLTNIIDIENKTIEEQYNILYNLQRIISQIERSLFSTPTITIKNRRDGGDASVIQYTPADKRISIIYTNYKINIVNVNGIYAINSQTDDNRQTTLITDSNANIIETLKRGLKSVKTFLHISDKETDTKPEKITILNRNDNNSLSTRRM